MGLWAALFESGVDAVVAGLAIGLATSAYPPSREDLERSTGDHALLPRAADARARLPGPRQPDLGDLAERAAAVPPAPVDELGHRAAVRAGQRGLHVDGDLSRRAVTSR
jgi:hypothetical protein